MRFRWIGYESCKNQEREIIKNETISLSSCDNGNIGNVIYFLITSEDEVLPAFEYHYDIENRIRGIDFLCEDIYISFNKDIIFHGITYKSNTNISSIRDPASFS